AGGEPDTEERPLGKEEIAHLALAAILLAAAKELEKPIDRRRILRHQSGLGADAAFQAQVDEPPHVLREPGRANLRAPAHALAATSVARLLRSQFDTEHLLLQFRELVAHARRLLELEVARVAEHLLLQRLDLARELLFAHALVAYRVLERLHVLRLVHAVDQ